MLLDGLKSCTFICQNHCTIVCQNHCTLVYHLQVEHFTTLQAKEMPSEANRTEIKPLNEVDRSKFKTKPEVRDFKSYQELLERGNAC
jgi:hypothetical protein